MVSIIVPVYNGISCLERCIHSITSQEYADTEVLIIDDGSTDGTGLLCDVLMQEDSRIQVFHTGNHGVSHARNIGLKNSRGEFVQFVDADDYVDKEFSATLVREIEHDSWYWVCCGFWTVNNRIVGAARGINLEILGIHELCMHFNKLYYEKHFNILWNKIYRRTMITEFFDESTSLGEDLIFNIQYMKNAGKIKYIQTPLYFFTSGSDGSNLSRSYKEPTLYTLLKINAIVKDYIIQNLDNRIDWRLISNSLYQDIYRCIYRSAMANHSTKKIEETIIEITRIVKHHFPGTIPDKMKFRAFYHVFWGFKPVLLAKMFTIYSGVQRTKLNLYRILLGR